MGMHAHGHSRCQKHSGMNTGRAELALLVLRRPTHLTVHMGKGAAIIDEAPRPSAPPIQDTQLRSALTYQLPGTACTSGLTH